MAKSVRELFEPGTHLKFKTSPVKRSVTARRMGKSRRIGARESNEYDAGTKVRF